MSREDVLATVRSALGRSAGQPPSAPVPPPLIRVPEDSPVENRIIQFSKALTALNGNVFVAVSPEAARDYVEKALASRDAIASNAPFLAECGITSLANVRSGVTDHAELRGLCAQRGVGITSAAYALADTGSLVMLSSAEEPRMISLLPPCHIAVVPRARLLSGLDELFTLLPHPAEASSSMVFITGPSRTADIEQFLVRGVHGPGEIHAVIV